MISVCTTNHSVFVFCSQDTDDVTQEPDSSPGKRHSNLLNLVSTVNGTTEKDEKVFSRQ